MGLAGLQLVHQIINSPYFNSKSILLIDKSSKSTNDKTWCFWEQKHGNWDHLVYHSWDKTEFINSTNSTSINLNPYRYKMIRAIDFYDQIKKEISQRQNLTWLKDEVLDITENQQQNYAKINCNTSIFNAHHVFDSRLPKSFFNDSKSIKLKQHFKGLLIKTKDSTFTTDKFTIMDFSVKYKDSTSFMYVLPLTDQTALIEFTFFNLELVHDSVYDETIEHYISTNLNIKDYEVLDVEKGIIPMSDFNFNASHSKFISKIGTAGGWVKPSTGYSFKRTETFVSQIINQLKQETIIKNPSSSWRYRFYDRIFLNVLANENEKGEWIFSKFYSRNPIQMVFKYLDEQTTVYQDFKIMLSLFSMSFVRALFRVLLRN